MDRASHLQTAHFFHILERTLPLPGRVPFSALPWRPAEFEPRPRAHDASFYRRLHWESGAIGQTLYLEAEAVGMRGTGIGCFFDNTLRQFLGITDRRFQTLYHFTVGGPLEDSRLRTAPPYAHLTP